MFPGSTLTPGVLAVAYSQTLTALDICINPTTLTYSLESAAFPGGLTLSTGGTISGTPTATGSFDFTIDVKDSGGNTASAAFALTITAAVPITITTSSTLPQATVGAAYSQTLSATGGSPPYTWSVTSGALPAGLTLASGGAISGTPTAAGTFSFTVQATDSVSATGSTTLTVTIVAAPTALAITTASPLLSGYVSGAYSQTFRATGGTPPYAWSVTAGALPGGLTLSGGGTLAGQPSAAGNSNFTVKVVDSNSTAVTGAFAITVIPAASLARVGVLSQFAAGGGWDTTIWVINTSSAAVPVSLVFHGDDGTLSLKDASGNVTPTPLTATQQGDIETGITATTLDRVLNANTGLLVGCGLSQSDNVEGWIDVLSTTASVSGFGVFRYAPGGLTPGATGFVTPWEGTVPLQTQLTPSTLTLPFDNTNGFNNGVAIGNLSNTPGATITATFYDINGGSTLGSPQTLTPLPANGHTSFMLYLQFPSTANKQGTVVFTGTTMMGLGLRASPYGTLTSVPVILQ